MVVDILVKELVISCQLLSQVGYFVIYQLLTDTPVYICIYDKSCTKEQNSTYLDSNRIEQILTHRFPLFSCSLSQASFHYVEIPF